MKTANPDGRFWLKLDATDLKEALMESLTGVWNGDVDLGDGKLEELRREYDQRVTLVSNIAGIDNRDGLQLELQKLIDSLEDISFLDDIFHLAVEDYRKNLRIDQHQRKTLRMPIGMLSNSKLSSSRHNP